MSYHRACCCGGSPPTSNCTGIIPPKTIIFNRSGGSPTTYYYSHSIDPRAITAPYAYRWVYNLVPNKYIGENSGYCESDPYCNLAGDLMMTLFASDIYGLDFIGSPDRLEISNCYDFASPFPYSTSALPANRPCTGTVGGLYKLNTYSGTNSYGDTLTFTAPVANDIIWTAIGNFPTDNGSPGAYEIWHAFWDYNNTLVNSIVSDGCVFPYLCGAYIDNLECKERGAITDVISVYKIGCPEQIIGSSCDCGGSYSFSDNNNEGQGTYLNGIGVLERAYIIKVQFCDSSSFIYSFNITSDVIASGTQAQLSGWWIVTILNNALLTEYLTYWFPSEPIGIALLPSYTLTPCP